MPHQFPYQPQVIYALEIAALVSFSIFILGSIDVFFNRIGTLVAIVIGAMFFAYAVSPAVVWLEHRVARPTAIAIVYCSLVGALAIALVVVVPIFVNDLSALGDDMSKASASYQQQTVNMPLVARLPLTLRNDVVHAPERIATAIAGLGTAAATAIFGFALSAAAIVALIIVVPVLAIYFLTEVNSIRRHVLGWIPPAARLPAARVGREIDTIIGGFIRGQFIVATVVGTLITVLLLILHVKYALLIGVFAGILDVIPYVGAVAGWLPAVAISLLTNGWQNALLVTIGIIVINQLEGNVILPRIMSDKIGLSPLVVIIALFLGGELFGILGLLVAVPAVAVARVIATKVVDETLPPAE
ncbi:MAG: AI-2E family transporter [Vulcanimicrobiaceae bacterium]